MHCIHDTDRGYDTTNIPTLELLELLELLLGLEFLELLRGVLLRPGGVRPRPRRLGVDGGELDAELDDGPVFDLLPASKRRRRRRGPAELGSAGRRDNGRPGEGALGSYFKIHTTR